MTVAEALDLASTKLREEANSLRLSMCKTRRGHFPKTDVGYAARAEWKRLVALSLAVLRAKNHLAKIA